MANRADGYEKERVTIECEMHIRSNLLLHTVMVKSNGTMKSAIEVIVSLAVAVVVQLKTSTHFQKVVD